MSRIRFVLSVALLALLPCLTACQEAGYYAQAFSGQMALVFKRTAIPKVMADPRTSARLRGQLVAVQRIRAFAGSDLGLPAEQDFSSYVELGRPYAVWSVMAAPELSLQARQWCYWVVGCLDYRGYFSAAGAERLAASLRAEGDDVFVGGVPAYSTIGWLSDPVLSSFVYDAEPELAEMMFHELAHVLLFVPGDTVFNESFAVTVAAEGLRRYTAAHPMDLGELQEAKLRQAQFVALVLDYRARLQTAFTAPATVAQKRAAKQQLYAALQADYVRLRTQWGGYAGYDSWFRQANNASMNTVATYYDEVPALQRLLAAGHNDLPTFYAACRRLAKMSPAARLAELKKS